MIFDLGTIRAAVSVGAGVAHLVTQLVADISAVKHDPAAIADVLADLSEGADHIVDAVRSGTVAEDEDDPARRVAQADGADDGVQSVPVKD